LLGRRFRLRIGNPISRILSSGHFPPAAERGADEAPRVRRMGALEGKAAVVTGAASGIGLGIATRFAAEGAGVVLADIDDERGAKAAADVGGVFVHCDVTVEADIEAAVAAAVSRFGRLDCMVANAGAGGTSGPITELDADGFDSTVALLYKGVALCMKHGCRAIQAGGRGGSIIATSSIAGLVAGCGPHTYSSCKAAVVGLTRTVALEQGEFGIRVNCINPGAIETAIFGRGGAEAGYDPSQALQVITTAISANTPAGRIGLPADIAGAALWLASDDSAYVTGQAIVVDGGFSAIRPLLSSPLPRSQ
jgi:NAD(P)-dependent dehydrogenase (short-subunit alcohol dehydrogenase family)